MPIFLVVLIAVAGGLFAYLSRDSKNINQPVQLGGSHPATASSLDLRLEPKTNNEGGTQVVIQPLDRLEATTAWGFEITLDTHAGDLGDDLTQVSELRDGAGNRYQPLAWEGNAPGGHHRKGVLRFQPIVPRPASIMLILRGVSGISERTFIWTLANGQ